MYFFRLWILRFFFCGLMCLYAGHRAEAQTYGRENYKIAKEYLQSGDYLRALSLLEAADTLRRKPQGLAYKLGLCYARLNRPQEALSQFERAVKSEWTPADVYKQLGLACHLLERFDSAAQYYKEYIERLPSGDPRTRDIRIRLNQCEWAGGWLELSEQGQFAVVNAMGDELNSQNDDYGARFHPQHYYNLYFSSNRRFGKSNLFHAAFATGSWTTGDTILHYYNTADRAEDMEGFYGGQSTRLIFRRDGKLWEENRDAPVGSEVLFLPFAAELQAQPGEQADYQWFGDSLVVFASRRNGGYGGWDLYYSIRTDTGWAVPRNMGPRINSPHDERAPFLEADGRTLRYSAALPKGLGGYDFYETYFSDTTLEWRKPRMLLPPFSSCGEDLHWVSHDEGWQVFFSSSRPGGTGGLDLYGAYLLRPQRFWNSGTHFAEYLEGKRQGSPQPPADTFQVVELEEIALPTVFYPRSVGNWLGDKAFLTAVEALNRHPGLRLVIHAHSDNNGVRQYDVFLSLQQAEKLAARLIEKGCAAEQIWLRGCGQHAPIARNELPNGAPNVSGRNMNQRMETHVLLPPQAPVSLSYNLPVVSEVMDTAAGIRYRAQTAELSYRVVALQSNTFLQETFYDISPWLSAERHPGQEKADYCIGLEKQFAQAQNLLQKLRQRGNRQARIVAYWDGFPLHPDQIPELLPLYPDLEQYLRYLNQKE